MKFCEKCISYDMCNYEYEHQDTDVILTFFPNNTACPWFKNKSGFVKVKHGEWISVEGDVIFKCSVCEAEISTSWDYDNEYMFCYCPCCGAKMDGGMKE